jgi:hypothetical protein
MSRNNTKGKRAARFFKDVADGRPVEAVTKAWSHLKGALENNRHLYTRPVPLPLFGDADPILESVCYQPGGETHRWYHSPIITAEYIGQLAESPSCMKRAVEVCAKLIPDDYISYLLGYYREGHARFGDRWKYADICTAVLASASVLKPASYLEIGVRRGRSMAMVIAENPEVSVTGFDKWIEKYAHMENPGPSFVKDEMAALGHTGELELVNGDSHVTLPAYFAKNPGKFFDLMTVDGDHSIRGASLDLHMVLPRLKVGGVLVFDDISQPGLRLGGVWKKFISSQDRFSSWEFTSLGYGVGIAIRKY